MLDKTTTIERFLEAAAAKQPTPGGGSVSALSGALAAAMGEMVLNYSVGKKGLEMHVDRLQLALGEFQRAQEMMLELMVEDQSAFEQLAAAKKTKDETKIAGAIGICAGVPMTIAGTALAVIELAESVAMIANQYLLSDLAVCAELAMATVRTSLYNVRVNLPEIRDSSERKNIEATGAQILQKATAAIGRVIPAIWDRVQKGQ
jgi:formiminotetrahydrofolate cyclodeaminase